MSSNQKVKKFSKRVSLGRHPPHRALPGRVRVATSETHQRVAASVWCSGRTQVVQQEGSLGWWGPPFPSASGIPDVSIGSVQKVQSIRLLKEGVSTRKAMRGAVRGSLLLEPVLPLEPDTVDTRTPLPSHDPGPAQGGGGRGRRS